MDEKRVTVRLRREEGFRLAVNFEGESRAPLLVDEPPPLGDQAGPKATELLAAAVGTCLSQSLLFCLQRSRTEMEELETEVEAVVGRNDQGRLRVTEIRVKISPLLEEPPEGGNGKSRARLDRCLGLFEDFCTVAESIRGGIPIEVEVAEPVARR